MSGEIVAGKRTFIARAGRPDFELPGGHEVSVSRDDNGEVVAATLRWGDHNSMFFATMDEGEDRVTIRLGELVGAVGIGTSGETLGSIHYYPFPDD